VRFALKCPRCADVSVPPRDLELFLARGSAEAELAFDCPSCDTAVRAKCDQPIARLLTLSGASVHRVTEKGPPRHPLPPSEREAVSVRDEVTAFRTLLASDDWLDRLLAEPPGPAEAS
jgi:hypothetical protein